MPSPDTGSSFQYVRVHDCMHPGIITVAPDAPLAEVAATMAKHRIHAVGITNGGGQRISGIVSDLDIVAAAATGTEPTAGQVAGTEPLSISAEAPLDRAVQLMAEHGVSHLIVLGGASGYPVGVLSTLDVAAVYAGGTD